MQASSAIAYLPERLTMPHLRDAVQGCRGCDLYAHATQAVFGEGSASPRIVFVGEQPGDEEDRRGHPFVGPAGRLLDEALEEAGIDRSEIYITNAVKHFKFEERGKRRLHKKPSGPEIRACRPWLEAELALLHPRLVVCLGATAAQSLLGPTYRVTQQRGRMVQHPQLGSVTSTVHPSAILRAPDSEERRVEYNRFVADLKKIRQSIEQR